MSAARCIDEPISWLRLERFALADGDPAVRAHLDACPVCRQCLDSIRGDAVSLPALPAPRARQRWWVFALPAIAAAALVVFLVRPRGETRDEVARVKGVGEVVLGVVRERAGAIRQDVQAFAPGDRWKVVVTCPPDRGAWIDVAVVETGATTADYPVAPAHVACGNRVVVPGAFTLTGSRANHVCVRIAADAAPPRDVPHPGDDGVACVTIRPE